MVVTSSDVNNTIESPNENLINDLSTIQADVSGTNHVSIGIRYGEGDWHSFSSERILDWLQDNIETVTPLQLQLIFRLVAVGLFLRLYFALMPPFFYFWQSHPSRRGNLQRPEPEVIIRAPRYLRRFCPRLPQLRTRIPVNRGGPPAFFFYNIVFGGAFTAISYTVSRLNRLQNYLKDYQDKNKKNFIPLIFAPIETLQKLLDWIGSIDGAIFIIAMGIILFLYSIYLLFEFMLLIYIYNFDYFNIESKKNKYVKRYLKMINELYDKPGSIDTLLGLGRLGIKISLFYIIYGYIMFYYF